MENRFHYFTTRNAEKTSFTAIITEPVDGQNEFYVAPDLSNVLAMVNTYGDGDFGTVHVHNAEKLALVDFDTSYEYLAKDAVKMSKEYDNGASGDFAYKMSDDARLVEGEDVTFYMDLDRV
ncbi:MULTISPECIES: hypothetical protein [Klebsiella pneumoniae complex]|jgi:hypothetical protein|uniref:hypothetical protein n=1 Tax=Klebsiella pneumoniae complex TaxID=3390273 RepID=UPI000ABF4703|nr:MULTISPECIES: hypothetical protein [Klebsiella]HBN5850125.1 hypothetical protein [Klebsiella oxytoca]ELB5242712.1 hypothetical protein [Klebsiella pneumoniae]MDW3810592.1 hypothetical protein [Klebsiella pneumoniae]MDW3815818.1 hypothetical protein [Klebsiella pneumoniae]OVG26203.1 hypothetical protein B5L94_26790 [Klebsiella pneumoniae]